MARPPDIGRDAAAPPTDLRPYDRPRAEALAKDGPAEGAPTRDGPAEGAPPTDGPVADADAPTDTTPDAATCPGTGTALIGPTGGVLFSADCKARLLVPAGALSAPTQLIMATASPPPGSVTVSYDIGPTGLVFSSPATLTLPYAPGALSGATEAKLTIGSAAAGEWTPVGNSTVNQSAREVSSQLAHLSTYGGIPGDATGPVAKVLALGPAGGAGLGETGGASPVTGVPINASWFPLQGRSVSLQVSNPSLASIDVQGVLTAQSLGFPPLPATVTVTATVDSVSGTLPVLVSPRPVASVVASGSYALQDRTGAPVGDVLLSHLQNPSTTLTIGPSGTFSALPPLPAGSFYTIKLEKTGFLPTYHTWWSLLMDSSVTSRIYPMYSAADVSALACSATVDPARGHVLISGSPPAADASGWEYFVSSAGATVSYLTPAGTPDCAATGTSSTGAALLLNVAPGYNWVMAKKGILVVGMIVYVPSGSSVTLVTFS